MSKIFDTPEAVEAAFYEAIERADIAALDEVWSDDDNIVCVHPGATRIEGRQAVMDSFVELFSDAPTLHFSVFDIMHTGNEGLAVHLVREQIELDGHVVSNLVSTNIYHRELAGWRMLLHHASPEPDAAYQEEYDSYQGFDALDFDDFDDDLDEPDEPSQPPVLH